LIAMLEHQIRLRRGWEIREAASPESRVGRLELPVRWNFDRPTRIFLTRRFGRVAHDPTRQVLLLQMDQVCGIHAMSVNGQPVAGVSSAAAQYTLELHELAERNILTLEIETPPGGALPDGRSRDWGVIALVVRTIDATDDPLAEQIATSVDGGLDLEYS
jgi:hypothetical protein